MNTQKKSAVSTMLCVQNILNIHDFFNKKSHQPLPQSINNAHKASLLNTIIFSCLVGFGIYQTAKSATENRMDLTAIFAGLTLVGATGVASSLHRRKVCEYYIGQVASIGAQRTEQNMREFVRPLKKPSLGND